MKILLTGGGTAGHFYPLIAITEEIYRLSDEGKLLPPRFYFMSTTPYDKKTLFLNDIEFKRIFSGKKRVYFSLFNITDSVKTILGILKAIIDLYFIYPDIVISKGGYASVPALFAAWLLRIPVVIHESDTVPGRVNMWSARFAKRIAISWPEAALFFDKEKTAVTGQPVRKELRKTASSGAHEYLKLDRLIPVILILGGSQGAQIINTAVLNILPELVLKYQVIHQVGKKNVKEISGLVSVILAKNNNRDRYKPFGYLDGLALRMSAGAASLVVSRAGSTLFEIASWGLPSIVIPITESNGDHQRKNAFSYARRGAAVVIEEKNLTPHVLLSEIDRLINNETLRKEMGNSANSFFDSSGGEKIAREVIKIALGHEK